MAAMSIISLELDQFPYPTSTLCGLASTLSVDVILCLYYTSQIQQLVMRGIVECLVHVKDGSVEAGDDDDDEEEGDFEEEDDYDEEESGEEEGDDSEGDGGDEPPAKRRKKDEDEDKKKKKEEKEGGKKEEEVCLRLKLELIWRRKVKRKKRMRMRRTMMKKDTMMKYHVTIYEFTNHV